MPSGRCEICRKRILLSSLIYGALGDSYRQHGRWSEAKAWYLKALGFQDAPFSGSSPHICLAPSPIWS